MSDKQVSVGKMKNEKKIENPSRRKAVKTLAAGAGALAAYHTLPVNWSTPIIEQVFLPAHAQTSGAPSGPDQPIESDSISCEINFLGENDKEEYLLNVVFTVSPPVEGVLLGISYEKLTTSIDENESGGPFTTYPDTGAPVVTDSNGQIIIDFNSGFKDIFVSTTWTGTIVETGERTSCTWTGP